MKVKHIISFIRTPQENAEHQMMLSDALTTAVDSFSTTYVKYNDDLLFQVYWEGEFVEIEADNSTFRLTHQEALNQAASLRKATLDAGATVDYSYQNPG